MDKQISQELVTFIKQSPTAFHAVANMQNILIEHGYEELLEGQTFIWLFSGDGSNTGRY